MEDRSIPEELIVGEILPRLPVKSLLRFRSVCKAWYSTISDRDFIELHRHHSQSKVHVVHCSNDINIECLTEGRKLQHYYRLPRLQVNEIINSSHDLVVLDHNDGYLISNPSMQESLYLPHPPSRNYALFRMVGFGFVSPLGKYKVVNIASDITTPETTCEVFTVGMDNSWRIGTNPPYSIYASGHTPYVNGNLHKLTWRYDKDGNSRILLFNLEKETWTVMKMPNHQRKPQCGMYLEYTELREIQGFLCFVCCIVHKRTDIWMLRDYENEVWSKNFVIDVTLPTVMPDTVKFCITEIHGWLPLKVMADGRMLLQYSQSFMDDLWFYYDPEDGSIQLAGHQGSYTTLYAENLVPISGF